MSDQEEENSPQIKMYSNQNIVKSGKQMYLNTEMSDIHFSFDSIDGTVTHVAAHKCVLGTASDVFKAMFYGALAETGDVHLTDSTQGAFEEFLQFFYLNEVKLTKENIAEVMYLVQKYNVPDGINVCVEFLKDIPTANNVFIGWDLAILHDQRDLLKICENIIILDTSAVLNSADFLKCDKRTLDHILEMRVLSCSEALVFEACMAWVKAKSGQEVLSKQIVDTHLGDLFYKIRFASMEMEQLCTLSKEYDAVLCDDFKTIAHIISVAGYQTDKFNVNPRRAKWNEDAVIECNRALSEEYLTEFIGLWEREEITFTSNEPVLLGSFTCEKIGIGSASSVSDLENNWSVDIKIVETDDNYVFPRFILKMKTQLQSTSTKIQLPQPILIRPGHYYIIHIGPFPEGEYYRHYSKPLKTKVKLENNITIEFHSDKSWRINGTTSIVNLISALNFNRI